MQLLANSGRRSSVRPASQPGPLLRPEALRAGSPFKSHWELIRRYVAVGPPSVIGQIQFSIPISEKRESLSVGIIACWQTVGRRLPGGNTSGQATALLFSQARQSELSSD